MPDVFSRTLPTPAEDALEMVKHLLRTVTSNREMLLAVILAGKTQFINECHTSFRGLPVGDAEFERMWHYIHARRGPGDQAALEFEFEWLQAQREQREAAEKAERDALIELGERAHGKDAQAELGKWGTFH